jgi:hypothetical protein
LHSQGRFDFVGMNLRVAAMSFGVLASVAFASACGKSAKNPGTTTADGAAGTGVGGVDSGSGTDTGTAGEVACDGDTVLVPKRIVRLSFNQLSNTIHALFGDTLGRQIDVDFEIGAESPVARTFPPLASPSEGAVIGTAVFPVNDQIAGAAGDYTLAHLDAVTSCGPEPTEACASAFVAAFAERAFRRPLTEAETISLAQLYTEVKGTSGTVPEAIQYTVYGLLHAPQFLYRTELGADPAQAGPITPHELASELSYFLTDGPPDQELLDAARERKLSTKSEIMAQVARILLASRAQKNLESAMFSYFRLDNLATVKIDNRAFTSGTSARPYLGVRESAARESQLFFEKVLWGRPLRELLTARTGAINTTLAALYAITLPTTPADETEFVQVELPATRGGLLTQAAFLASGSRPDGDDSIIPRGLVVNMALLCAHNPLFPDDPTILEKVTQAPGWDATARERVEYRTTTEPCSDCHRRFDAYGLALHSYDLIGRYRTVDSQGRVIEPSVTLPANAGGGLAEDAIDMERQIADSPAFASCMAKSFFDWALAEGVPVPTSSCSIQSVVAGFEASDKTFSDLLREIAVSEGFTRRLAGLSQ